MQVSNMLEKALRGGVVAEDITGAHARIVVACIIH